MSLSPLYRLLLFAVVLFSLSTAFAFEAEICPRPPVGSTVSEPQDIFSKNGVLKVDLEFRSSSTNGEKRFCFVVPDGSEAPTLHARPGDQVVITLKNAVSESGSKMTMNRRLSCTNNMMTEASANLHFHGLVIPPACHIDDTLNTAVEPSDPPFEYRFSIPEDQPPGLYWYHPHIHGFAKAQILGGASGALIVDGIANAEPAVAGLPERIFVIRDQELMNPNAEPVKTDSMPLPQVLRDAEGDILNTGTGGGKPAKDLSINYVPVPFPQYQPAVITMKSGEREFWRVLNASAITYLDLQVLFNDRAQWVQVIALDGIPVNHEGHQEPLLKSHMLLPPAGRAEFIVKGPAENVKAALVTRTVDTGPAGENDPTRPLAEIIARADAPEPQHRISPVGQKSASPLSSSPLARVEPQHQRLLYFSEMPQDPKDPKSPTRFFITVDGQAPKMFDPNSTGPDLTVQSGEVEDWVIENRTQELHAFHIHQIHFQLMEWNGVPVNEPYLRDTINVPYWDGSSRVFPRVKLRMDFRDPQIAGIFPYHCHLLEHQDGGMMGTIRVLPPQHKTAKKTTDLHASVSIGQ